LNGLLLEEIINYQEAVAFQELQRDLTGKYCCDEAHFG